MLGLTAYSGLIVQCQPRSGETVVVSAASGGVGQVAVQLARLAGCRVVGIAGGPEKWDVFFDNVSGPILEAALNYLNLYSRVVMCGGIANYNAKEPVPGPNNLMNLVTNRGRMQGFIILDYLLRAREAFEALMGWLASGDIIYQVDMQEGFENIPSTLQRLYTGQNWGKQLLKIADPV